jgi:hypothetical protein
VKGGIMFDIDDTDPILNDLDETDPIIREK